MEVNIHLRKTAQTGTKRAGPWYQARATRSCAWRKTCRESLISGEMLSTTRNILSRFRSLYTKKCLVAHAIRCTASSSTNWNNAEHNSVVFLRARDFRERIAIVDSNGSHSYDCLLQLSKSIGDGVLKRTGRRDLNGCCVAFLCPNDVSYVATQWAIWRNGGIAVPLCNSHPTSMYEYTIEDCNASIFICSNEYANKLEPMVKKNEVDLMFLSDVSQGQGVSSKEPTAVEQSEECWDERDAMIVYTSGTTGRPKGVLSTHGNLRFADCCEKSRKGGDRGIEGWGVGGGVGGITWVEREQEVEELRKIPIIEYIIYSNCKSMVVRGVGIQGWECLEEETPI